MGGPKRRWSDPFPRGSVVRHPAVLAFVAKGDPGTRPKRHVVQHQRIVAYSATRVTMKRVAWEMMEPGDLFVQWVRPTGEEAWAFAMTRAELEEVFGQVRETVSWSRDEFYNFPSEPAAARAFRVRLPVAGSKGTA